MAIITVLRMLRLVLDFDGVLCDSVHEAFYATWVAYHRYQRERVPNHISLQTRTTFYRYRPFIRTGQHLMLLQHIIAEGIQLHSQDDFERELLQISEEQQQQWRSWLYQVREEMREGDQELQLRLQPLYPGVQKLLLTLSSTDGVIILSTKRTDFIAAILAHNRVPWRSDYIYSVQKESKIDVIQRLQHATPEQHTIIFIDDHLPHLLSRPEATARNMRCLLANWGYVLPEWCRNRHYETIDLADLRSLVASLFSV